MTYCEAMLKVLEGKGAAVYRTGWKEKGLRIGYLPKEIIEKVMPSEYSCESGIFIRFDKIKKYYSLGWAPFWDDYMNKDWCLDETFNVFRNY